MQQNTKVRKSLPKCCSSLWGGGSRTFLPGFLHSLENPPHITTIVRATLLSQSKDQNSSHVSREQMSYQLGWCEHRYNADRKPRQSLVEPIMGRAVGAGLQTRLFLCRATLRYMINFLTNSTQAARRSALCRWQSWWVGAQPCWHQATKQNKKWAVSKRVNLADFMTNCTSTFFGV